MESHDGSFREDSRVLAELAEGHWLTEPPAGWRFDRMFSLQALTEAAARHGGAFVCAKAPMRNPKQLDLLNRHAGSLVLLTSQTTELPDMQAPVLRVADMQQGMDALAIACRQQYQGKTIAVTGSVGKTTTRRMLDHALLKKHSVHTYSSNMNGIMPVRRQVTELGDEEFATFEVARIALPGAEHVIQPDVAVIGALGEAHLSDLGSMQEIAQFKGQLLNGVPKSGAAVINLDSPYVSEVLAIADDRGLRVLTYGISAAADLRLIEFDEATSHCRVRLFGEEHEYAMSIAGRHNAVNGLAVLGVIAALGLPFVDYIAGVSSFTARRRRGRVIELPLDGKSVTVVDESFNANPTSMRTVLEGFADAHSGRRKVLVLGDMLELGPSSSFFHAALVPYITRISPAKVYLTGENMRTLVNLLPKSIDVVHADSAESLTDVVRADLADGDAVLVKSSNGVRLGRVVEAWASARSQ